MSKTIILSFFLLFFGQLAFSQEKSQFISHNLGFTIDEATQLREVVTKVTYNGFAEYKGVSFSRSGRYFDRIRIEKKNTHGDIVSLQSIEIPESMFLHFIDYLENKERFAALESTLFSPKDDLNVTHVLLVKNK